MIALRPPSYQTIEDPPPYPDDDDVDDCPLMCVGDKRLPDRSVTVTHRAGVDRLLANSGELMQLCEHDDADRRVTQPTVDRTVHQSRAAVGRRRRMEPLTCRRSVDSPGDLVNSSRAPWTNQRTCRLDDPDTSTRNNYSEQSWRHELSFDLPPAGSIRNSFSPSTTTTAQADSASPRHGHRSAGVPYSITCPSRFDGCLVDAARYAQPLDRSPGDEPAESAALRSSCTCDVYRAESRHTSSVFEISSYIIDNSSACNASVQPSDAVKL